MEPTDDTELELLRASTALLDDIRKLLPKLLWKTAKSEGRRVVHRYVRERDLQTFLKKLEPFQEDPQLLDAHLKFLLPDLVDAYLAAITRPENPVVKQSTLTSRCAICSILYTFCKIRGEKVVIGFLNNEPRYLELLLSVLGDTLIPSTHDQDFSAIGDLVWQERYVLLLWLSHQILTPFDLQTISSSSPDLAEYQAALAAKGLTLHDGLPSITLRILPICMQCLSSATRERTVAASLLTKLCLRPDMRKNGLLDDLVRWAISSLRLLSESNIEVHKVLGILTFITRVAASGSQDDLGVHLPAIFSLCQSINEDPVFSALRSSALARKLVIKAFRCIITVSLQPGSSAFDVDSALEEVVGSLLELLADNDSPVRYAASKGLSVITMALDAAMGAEIVEAILGSFLEDVLMMGSIRNLSAVNALRWHGLTLTLGHLLYQRTIATEQLPKVLNALILALNFEQRSATGSSIGANVRDAANFGLWAFSRRYTTAEWQAVDTEDLTALGSFHAASRSITEKVAIELCLSACCDPAGNIRRGSSAALQELIGRHPNTVTEGIALVQVVDYHAVGLRGRAMIEVGYEVSLLSPVYSDALLDALVGWRGTSAIDTQSRSFAGEAIGKIVCARKLEDVVLYGNRITQYLAGLTIRQVEERQGLMAAKAAIFTCSSVTAAKGSSQRTTTECSWKELLDALQLEPKCFTSTALRPELTAAAFLELTQSIASATSNSGTSHPDPQDLDTWLHLCELCLQRPEEAVLKWVPGAIQALAGVLNGNQLQSLVTSSEAALSGASPSRGRNAGFAMALGALHSHLPENERRAVAKLLSSRCIDAVEVEARVLALRGLEIITTTYKPRTQPVESNGEDPVAAGVLSGLNDYTTNERGDIGSLVRLAALSVTEAAWRAGMLDADEIYAAVIRLSLERLDKVRLQAVLCLQASKRAEVSIKPNVAVFAQDLSTYSYFRSSLDLYRSTSPEWLKRVVLIGILSSGGIGSESVVQVCRAALCDKMLAGVSAKTDHGGRETGTTKLLDMANMFLSILRDNITDDRILIPLLEVLAYILDMRLLQSLAGPQSGFAWRTLFVLVQKSHFKSTNMQKLFLAIDIYRGTILKDGNGKNIELRMEVVSKLASMLLHPFPKVRVKAAESLWVCGQWDILKGIDWSGDVKGLKDTVATVKRSITAETPK